MSTYMSMGSVNISITEDVYKMLRRLKTDDMSFSQIIVNLIREKDIRRCYGILSDRKGELAIVEREAAQARSSKWRRVGL